MDPMDPIISLQDVIRCDVCDTPVPSNHCDICHTHLCEDCVRGHLLDKSKDHYMVPFELRGIITSCQIHATQICKELCKDCNNPICVTCVASGDHDYHKRKDILKVFESKREDLQDLEKVIYPKYQEAASSIPAKRSVVIQQSQNLIRALNKQREAICLEIDNIMQKIRSEIADMDAQHMAAIDKQEETIKLTINETKQIILDLRRLLDTRDVRIVSKYKSRNKEFRRLPAQFQVTLPIFTPQEINREQMLQQFGSLSALAITYPFIDKPRVIADIQTEYKLLYSMSCLSDSELWTCGNNKIIRLYSLQGEMVKSVQTFSSNDPWDVSVTRSGDLLYTDYNDRSINLVRDSEIQPLIKVPGWKPHYLHCTSSGDLLVMMDSDDEQTKVVRYSDSTEIQIIQWDDQGRPLYSPGGYYSYKYLIENRNLDICVADRDAGAVVVVNAAGELRFRYIGPPSSTKKPFNPTGITTDSHNKILTADWNNNCIHILDQDGHFLRFIDNCDLRNPCGFCVDSRDNLYVAEYFTGKVKKIQYYK
ncbi:uncharacterized protein LOC111138127 isoform X2 [Crassostrea virginica]